MSTPIATDSIREEQGLLSAYSTFRIGGPCKRILHCSSEALVIEAVQALVAQNEDFVLMGGGSNLLISDQGFDGVIIRYVNPLLMLDPESEGLRVSCASSLDELGQWLAKMGWDGLSCIHGIPGTVGGAVVGNAGAWGEQIGDCVVSVRVITRAGEVKEYSPEDMDFSYRSSKLKETGDIALSVVLKLGEGVPSELKKKRAGILSLRAEKHPDLETHPCIGSIFKNIEASSAAERRQAAGHFLEEAGAKGMAVGDAQVFEKHANIIVNAGEATAQEVYDLHVQMIAAVKAHAGLELQREVRCLGAFDGVAEQKGFF